MNSPVLTFFNNKGGVGKTSLIYHLSWMFAELGKKVVVTDLDPQANLTAAFLFDEKLDELWNTSQTKGQAFTIYQSVKPLIDIGNIIDPQLQEITENLFLIPSDIALSNYEDTLSEVWPNSLAEKNLYRPILTLSAFWQVMQSAAKRVKADIILVDIGPNLGAINRSVLIATDYVVIPLGADLFSLQGLKNLGPTLVSWKKAWQKRLDNWQDNSADEYPDLQLPQGKMQVLGYLYQQYGVRLDRPVKSYDKWITRIPNIYRQEILLQKNAVTDIKPEMDEYQLAEIKHYRSLIPMGQECRKPIFKLTPADGAIGSHISAVKSAKEDFEKLARKILEKMNIDIS